MFGPRVDGVQDGLQVISLSKKEVLPVNHRVSAQKSQGRSLPNLHSLAVGPSRELA